VSAIATCGRSEGVIGIVVVTHGALAGELVNAARTIVGEIPSIAAVSIGWTDDMAMAHEAIERAMAEVGGPDVLILTDMFGGTPTNVSLPFLSPRVEIVTGVNLPMLIKLTSLREGELVEVARVIRDQGKGAIYVASEILEKKPS
jgi:mannose PTS system EIIA component